MKPITTLVLFVTCLTGFAVRELCAAKPNILHLHTDDHRADGLHALGNAQLQTPNLDAIVKRGFTFRHCYTQGSMIGAVCLPSRTMMLSGRSLFRIPDRGQTANSPVLPTVMREAGYETWHCGKGGNEFTAALEKFDTNLIMNDREIDRRRRSSESHADAAIKFIETRESTRPFYVYLAPPVPHDPRVAAPEFHRMYDAAQIELSRAFMPLHPFNNGDLFTRDEQLAPWPRTPQDTKQQLADYYACLTGLDFHFGRIFDSLKKEGEWENTIVIFTGDNGLSLGEHGLFGKQNLYEFGCMHVPMVIAGPGIPHGESDALVYLMDLFPTFCGWAQAETPSEVEGHSLMPIVQGKTQSVREVLYTAYSTAQRSIRDDRWKLIRYPEVNVTQLFDLHADPLELTNLAEQAEHADQVTRLLKLLQQEMDRYADTAPLTVENPQPAAWSLKDAVIQPRTKKPAPATSPSKKQSGN